MTTRLTTRYWKTAESFPPPPQKLGRQIPSNFAKVFTGTMTSFWKIFETETIFFSRPPLQGVWMLRFYYWVLKGPQLHKKFLGPRPLILEIWGQSFNFPTFSPKIGCAYPLHILHRYPRDDPQNPESFVKVSGTVSEIFGILLSEPLAKITRCLIP